MKCKYLLSKLRHSKEFKENYPQKVTLDRSFQNKTKKQKKLSRKICENEPKLMLVKYKI